MKNIFSFYFVFAFLLLGTYSGFANSYYVNPSSTASNALGTLLAPWKTIAQVNAGTTNLLPGDSVFFKRGETLIGELFCTRSGSISQPIVYTAYGNGEPPIFTNTKSDVIAIYNRQYIVLDGLKVTDKTMSLTDHSKIALISYAIIIDHSSNCTIRNCDISLVGIGIEITTGSENTVISNNYIHNLRIVRSTIGHDDDYGANAMVIGSSNNTIINNSFEACWAYCYDYGHDGGAVELFGQNMNNNIIAYNTAIECDGFLEIGSNADGNAVNNLIAYNKIINCGLVGTFHNNSSYTVTVNNTNFYNNNIIDTKKLFPALTNLFWFGDNTKVDAVIMRNNIIWLSSGINFSNGNLSAGLINHTNNIFKVSPGIIGLDLDSSELALNDLNANTLFIDTSGLAQNWDYHLKESSPAINFGIDVGLTKDFEGNNMIENPDAGIYEYDYIAPSIFKAVVTVDSILCNGGQTIIHLSAINGLPPYTGIGDFAVSAGTYVYTVSDATGLSNQITLTIGEPTKITISITPVYITNLNGTATVTVNALGGKPPYLYSFDNSVFQNSNVFYGIQDGAHLVQVKDNNGCVASFNNTIVDIPVTTVPNDRLVIRVNPNPTYTYFTLNAIKYRNRVYPMSVKVYNLTTGFLVYSTQTYSDHALRFGADFLPGNYVIVVEVAGTVQALQLLKL